MTSEKYTLMEQQADQHSFSTSEDVYYQDLAGASTNGGLGDGSPTISKMGGFATKGLH